MVYLNRASDCEVKYYPSEESLAETKQIIIENVELIKTRLIDVEHFVGHIDDFPRTEDISKCAECNFRRLCEIEEKRPLVWQKIPKR